MFHPVAWGFVLALVLLSFLAAVSAAAIGPGGVFLTAGLAAGTDLAPGVIAGSTSVTFFFGSLVAVLAYGRSGEYGVAGRSTVGVLAAMSAVGSFLGSQANAGLSEALFETLLGLFLIGIAILVWIRDRRVTPTTTATDRAVSPLIIGLVGLGTGFVSGLFGVGGPVVTVPLLLLLGLPMLVAVAVAHIQAVVITSAASAGYLLRGTVSVELVLALTVPFLIGIVLGWKVAHFVGGTRLRSALIAVLVVVGGYLVI